MKKILLASALAALASGAASAADLPRKVAPPVFTQVPLFTWTGFYAGLHTGYAFTDNPNIITRGNQAGTEANVANNFRPRSLRSEVDGFSKIGGGFGVNYQLTPGSGLVLGAAFDITWTDLHKSTGFTGAFNAAQGGNNVSIFRQNLDYLGTMNGRIGYAFDRFMVYGTGGLAFGNVMYGASFFGTQAGPGATPFPLQFIGGYDVRFETGYNYGGGIEYALPADNFLGNFAFGKLFGIKSDVTIKAEYIHYDLGTRNITVLNTAGAGTSYNSRFATEGSLIRAGFNYKFGGLY